MGFILTSGTMAGDRQPSGRTLPEAVDRIMSSCGFPSVGTVESPTKNITMAVGCVNDALEIIWSAANWRWRYRWVLFNYEDKRFLYDLPADFVLAGSSFLCMAHKFPMVFVDYHDLVAKHPQIAFVPQVQQVTDGGLTYAGRILAFFSDPETSGLTGIPSKWTIVGNQLGLFPVPNSDVVDSTEFSTRMFNVMGYSGSFNRLSSNSDTMPLPPELLAAHHFIALGMFKQALEFPDYAADERRGSSLLRREVTRSKMYDQGGAFGFDIGVP